jgi:hypothetical protein
MSKFIDSLMTKSASEAIEILAAKYAEVQEAKRTNYVKSAAGMYDSVLKSFADMPEESRRAIIGGAAGAGIGGLGSLGAGYVKHKKLRLSDALYGALAGAVPGAAIGALSTPSAPVAPAAPDFIDGPGLRGPLASQGGPKNPERPWTFAPIAAMRTMFNPREQDRVSPINNIGDNLVGVTTGGTLGGIGGAYAGSKAPGAILDLVGALKAPKVTAGHAPADIVRLFKSTAKKSPEELMRMNSWAHVPLKDGRIPKLPHSNDRLFGGSITRGGIKNVGGIAGGILGFLTGANAGGAVSNAAGDASKAIRDYQNKP